MLPLDEVVAAAQAAKEQGATRFCMGAAWRAPKDRDLDAVEDMVKAVKALGLETCATLGMLEEAQAEVNLRRSAEYEAEKARQQAIVDAQTAPHPGTGLATTIGNPEDFVGLNSMGDPVDSAGNVLPFFCFSFPFLILQSPWRR